MQVQSNPLFYKQYRNVLSLSLHVSLQIWPVCSPSTCHGLSIYPLGLLVGTLAEGFSPVYLLLLHIKCLCPVSPSNNKLFKGRASTLVVFTSHCQAQWLTLGRCSVNLLSWMELSWVSAILKTPYVLMANSLCVYPYASSQMHPLNEGIEQIRDSRQRSRLKQGSPQRLHRASSRGKGWEESQFATCLW